MPYTSVVMYTCGVTTPGECQNGLASLQCSPLCFLLVVRVDVTAILGGVCYHYRHLNTFVLL